MRLRFGKSKRIPLRGPWALVIGVICIGVAVYQYLTSSALAAHGIETRAVVVDVDSRRQSSGSSSSIGRRTYALTLEFEDRAGTSHRERTGYSKSHRSRRVGERVAILYNPNDPSEFALNSWYDLWAMPALFLAAGVIGCGAFLFGPGQR